MEIYIWSISGADMGFVSGFNKNWADITWYNIKATYGPYQILYGSNFIWDGYVADITWYKWKFISGLYKAFSGSDLICMH